MAVVYLFSGDTLIALDATTNVSRTISAQTTSTTIQNGSNISDHYHSSLPTISFSGVITNSKSARQNTPDLESFTTLVDQLIASKVPFTLYGDDGGIPDLDLCLITSFAVSKDVTNFDSLQVSITVSQIDISRPSQLNKVTLPSVKTLGQLASKKEKGTGSKTNADDKYTQAKLKELKLGRFAVDTEE